MSNASCLETKIKILFQFTHTTFEIDPTFFAYTQQLGLIFRPTNSLQKQKTELFSEFGFKFRWPTRART